mmetsp:Transcript_26490/g.60331  ORF Transcript_26490/g.60331 Transcript_26490/m.60331 type:complete len:271 (+) Transcript_26490:602-1414(+)
MYKYIEKNVERGSSVASGSCTPLYSVSDIDTTNQKISETMEAAEKRYRTMSQLLHESNLESLYRWIVAHMKRRKLKSCVQHMAMHWHANKLYQNIIKKMRIRWRRRIFIFWRAQQIQSLKLISICLRRLRRDILVEYFKRWKMTQHGRPEAEANTAHLKKRIENQFAVNAMRTWKSQILRTHTFRSISLRSAIRSCWSQWKGMRSTKSWRKNALCAWWMRWCQSRSTQWHEQMCLILRGFLRWRGFVMNQQRNRRRQLKIQAECITGSFV